MSSGFINPSSPVIPGSSPNFTRVLVEDGSAAAPSYAFRTAPTNGFFLKSAVQIGISVAGVEGGYIWVPSANTIRLAGAANNYFEANNLGAISLQCAGANQDINLNPSGSGVVNTGPLIATQGTKFDRSGTTAIMQTRQNNFEFRNVNNQTVWALTGAASQNLLLKKITDAGNGALQLADHTTAAGGIGLGADVALFRAAAGVMKSDSSLTLVAAAANGGAGTVSYGGTVATTVGAAGGAAALPATPLGYIIANVAGTQVKIPYYNN